MDNQEAIKIIERETVDIINSPDNIFSDKMYEFIDALKLAIAALEKQEPQESPCINPVSIKAFDGVDSVVTYKCVPCPVCGKWLSIHGAQKNYCEFCGQAVKLKEGVS